MHNFLRVVRMALRRRWTCAGIVLTSLGVALLWGANIGTVYPLVDVVFHRQSLQNYLTDQIAKADANLTQIDAEIETLALANVPAQTATEDSQRALAAAEQRRLYEERGRQAHAWLLPWVERYFPNDPFQTLVLILGVLMVGTLVKSLLLVANLLLVERLSQSTLYELRDSCFRQTLRMDLACFGQDRTSNLLSRFTGDMGNVYSGIYELFGRTLREPLKALACLIGAGLICWRLLLFSLLISPLAALLVVSLSKSLKRAHRRAMEQVAQLYAVLGETFGGIPVVKACGGEKRERQRFRATARLNYRRAMRIRLYDALSKPAVEIMGMGMISLAILAGGYLVMNEQTHLFGVRMTDRPLTLGSLMAFYAMLVGVSDPARKMSEVSGFLQRSAAAADRVFELIDRQPSVADAPSPVRVPTPFRELTFERVSFAYVPERPVLREVNLTIQAGETLAIVGGNGCGKSTLANLVCRFADPTQGAVRVNGVDLRQLRQREWRRHIGLVTQQPLLFDDTVFNNIRYGAPHATRAEVEATAQRAHAHRFILEKLEHGYDTIVGEHGARLSGGQRQRIALARAMLRNPALLILDEATSQVDIADEQLIHEVLAEFVRGRTTIMITHRLSTLALADRILVMEAGRIADLGTHHELLARCPAYARLHEIQFRQAG